MTPKKVRKIGHISGVAKNCGVESHHSSKMGSNPPFWSNPLPLYWQPLFFRNRGTPHPFFAVIFRSPKKRLISIHLPFDSL